MPLADRLVRQRAYQLAAKHVGRPGTTPGRRPYNLTIGREPRFVWYRVAKVATRTVLAHLEAHCQLETREAFNTYLPHGAHRDGLHFAFVRDPFDRLVSSWSDKAVAKERFKVSDAERESFPAFVQWVSRLDLDTCDLHLRRQSRLIDLDRVDFVGRFERLSDDLAELCRRLDIPQVDSHRNRSAHRPYRDYYDDETVEIVTGLYERDLRIFGYDWDG